MKTRFIPILFKKDMVEAILSGTKTQTRRVIKEVVGCYFQSLVYHASGRLTFVKNGITNPEEKDVIQIKRKYNVGDVLWVRETFFNNWIEDEYDEFSKFCYKAGFPETSKQDGEIYNVNDFKWKPSIYMPKEACRIFLKITDYRLERLQDISEPDAKAEGVKYEDFIGQYNCYSCDGSGHKATYNICQDGFFNTAKDSFKSLWFEINGIDSWQSNPFVWVVEFERIDQPKDFLTLETATK